MNRPRSHRLRSHRLFQAAIALFLGLTTCASTPGHISGCSTTASGTDPVAFCRAKEARVCARINAVEHDEPEYQACVSRIDANCGAANWSSGCQPTQPALDACLAALVDAGRITVPPDELPECVNLCGGAGGGIDPEGI